MKYRIVCYMRIEPEPEDMRLFDDKQSALDEAEQLGFIHDDCRYDIEEYDS